MAEKDGEERERDRNKRTKIVVDREERLSSQAELAAKYQKVEDRPPKWN